MSDIFSFNDYNKDYKTPAQQNDHLKSEQEFWNKTNERRQQLNEEYQRDLEAYSVNISQEDYNIIKDAIANADVPEDEAYRWACAMELNKQYGTPISYGYQNLENINQALWGDRFTFTPKTNFKAIVDSGKLGVNTLKMGQIGSKIMRAEMLGTTTIDKEFYDLEDLKRKYAALEQENVGLQDYEKRNFAIEALKFGAQSAPYTGYVAGVGLLGSLIAPGVGTAAAFTVSMNNAAGLEYMKLRQSGSTVGDAAGFSILAGGLEALVETSLGNVAGALGKNSLGDLATRAVKEKITGNVFKRLAYDGTFKTLALRMGKEWVKENAEEGIEEVVQDLIEKGTDALAAELGGYEIDPITAKQVAKDAWENFRGGVLGSLVLGLGPSVIKSKADVKDFVNVRKVAGVTPSFETFANVTNDSKVFDGMTDEEKRNAQKATWEREQARMDAEFTEEAKRIAEVQDAADVDEELKMGDEGEEAEPTPVTRDEETGKLYTQNVLDHDEEGNTTGGTFLAGDNKNTVEVNGEKKAARYGYINWEFADGDQNKIIINDFKMKKGREGIRVELFNEFAMQHPGVDIQWNTKKGIAQDIKNILIENNPSGKKNGLNYYADQNAIADASTRAWVDKQVSENIFDRESYVDEEGNTRYRKVQLSKEKRAAAVALLEAAAKRQHMSLTDYVNKTFGTQIFGDRRVLQRAAFAQAQQDIKNGKIPKAKAGGVDVGTAQAEWKKFGQEVKAVIYAGENADFSTWAHELAHIFQNQLEGDLKKQAEDAFGVKDGDWEHTMYTFADGKKMPAAEAFAYGFQDWLKTGKAENEQMKNIFKEFAKFIAQAYNSLKKFINLTPEITSVYEQLLSGEDSLLKAAEMAVEAEDRRYRAQMQQQAQEAENQKKAEAEQQKKAEEAERDENSETTEYEEEKEELTPEAAEEKLQEATSETEKKNNAIDDALENTNLTDNQKTEIADVLKDETTTVEEKAEAATDAASSVYEDEQIEIDPNLMFQLAGEPSIRRMAEGEERERILADLEAAQLLDDRYKSMDAKSKASRIRMMTGWEKDATGAWKFETDDSINRIKTEVFKNNPELLTDSSASTLLNLGDILDAPELYKIFPYMQNVRVSFYSDPNAFRAVLTPQGIKVNTRYLKGMNGETGLKGVLAHEIQHIIQAMEFAESKGIQGENIEKLYNDMMAAMQAAGERKYDYDLTSLQNGLDAYMKDAGEIEARNVARRILMNADQRRMNTLASTEDVQRSGIQFQDVTEEDLKERIDSIKHTSERADYIKRYYTDHPELYENKELTSRDGKLTGEIEISKDKKLKEEKTKIEIDAALKFKSMGYEPTILSESQKIGSEPHIDMLLNHDVLVEVKTLKGNAQTISNEIKDAMNKRNSEIITVLMFDNTDVTDDEIQEKLDWHGDHEHVHYDTDGIFIFRGDKITEIKKPRVVPKEARTSGTSNIAQESEAVKQKNNEYEEAVKAGDTEKVMQMLKEAAEHKGYNLSSDYQGTSAFNGAAPYRNGYYSTKEERIEAVKNEEFEDTATLGDYAYDNADPLGFEYMIEDPRSYRAADEKRKEAIDNLRKAVSEARSGKKNVTIKMYRSVPADIKEGSFRNGDWITPSKSYAKDNADVHGWSEGEYRIIEQDVDLEDIWWDGNDIAEWGYDDQKEYVYKNTENNRKLFEITYDKDGYLIPLSERFDENQPSILFQEVFHGSPHIIKKSGGDVIRDVELGFDHRKMGTGEGAQAFGWGTYVTQVEGIAKNYASKLGQMPYTEEENKRLAEINEIYSAPSKLLISIDSKKDFLKARRTSLRDLDNGKYEARINRNIKEFTKELKAAKKENDADNIKFYEDLINTSIDDLDPKRKEGLRKSFQKDIDDTLVEIDNLKKEQKEAAKLLAKQLPDLQKELEEIRTAAKARPAENVYTLDIPDETEGNYIPWNEPLSIEQYRAIYKQAKQEKLERFVGYLIEDVMLNDNTFTPPTGEWLYKNDLKWDISSDKEKSLFLNRAGITGISYPAQYLSGGREDNAKNYVLFNENDIKVTDWHAKNVEGDILFQDAYHGSSADFEKFDTDKYGLSGEGSMSFGYGAYVSGSKNIALDYAERQGNPIQYRIKALTEIIKEEEEILKENISDRLRYVKEKDLAKYKEELEKLKKQEPTEDEIRGKRIVYTVEIPNDGFIKWDENIDPKIVEGILKDNRYFYGLKNLLDNYNKWKDNPNATYLYGSNVYRTISKELGSDKAASHFLYNLGFKGIDYPAGTIYGNGEGSRNYVIFNDEDAKIVDKMFFQTQAELQDEALSFDNWQDFMEYCEAMHSDDAVSPIPYNADAQWYQSFYETAHGVQTEQEKNEKAVTEKVTKEGMLPGAADALFSTYIKQNPEMLDNFLKAVADLDAIDFNSDEWAQVADEEDAKAREHMDQLKDYIDITLSDYNWQTAIKRIQGGHEISEGLRKRLIGEITDSFKVRDFRALYSEVMEDEQYAVDEEDTTTAQLNKKLKKYKKYDILKPNEDIARVSPERRKRIAEALQNKEIAEKIRNGSLKLDDEIEAYLKSLNQQVKELQKEYNDLEKETQNDYQRLADAERRKLLKLHDDLLRARSQMKTRDAETDRKINKGLKITEKYQRQSQNLKADYDELFRKFTDLKNTMQITAEVQAALDRQERVAGIKEDLNSKQKEKSLVAEVKKMRIQLVKRAMRRVPFNRIDYENARTVIAIQRMLEPNLLGGVNRFIGIDSAYLRGVVSGIVTDSEYKNKILSYLRKQDKSSQAFADFLKKVEDLKTIKDFDSWTAKERKYAIKHLPKENWVRDLNLLKLAEEREQSIDLDIGMKEKQVMRIDPKTGRAMQDKEGNPIYETTFVLDAADDLKKLVRDAVGADMYDLIVDKPFAEWTTEELERLAQRIDQLYTEGRDMFAAKQEARKREADSIRKRVEDAIKETGITINDDDTPEERERKEEKIAKILNQKSGLKGTEAGKNSGIKAKFDRLIHGYWDANVLRVARILDNQSEGENVRLLYRREDECFNNKTRSIMARSATVKKVMADNKITEGDLAQTVKGLGTEFTVDELLYFIAADKDFEIDEKKAQKKSDDPLNDNDDYAATSRNAVMFGNMMSDNASQDLKEEWAQLDKAMQEAIENDTLTAEQRQELATGQLDKKPGTTKFISYCHSKWIGVLNIANNFLTTHPEYKALMEAIEADYASQYERMNEISINEFNTPVHRVRAYVPLVRRESNGADNVQQVKEDLLAAYGGEAGKQWVNKGMTQRRQNISPLNQKPVQTGLFRTWGDSIERTEHFIAYAPYVRQLNAIYKSRDAAYTRRFIESRYGKYAVQYLDEYINEVANPNAGRIREKGAELLHVLRGKTAPAYLGWKASGIIKQGLTSPWPYMQFVNPAEYTAAALKFTFNPEMRDAISEKSIYMKMRRMDPVNDLIDEMAENAKGKVDRAWSKFSQIGMQGLEMIDWACVAPGWLACYEKKYNQLQNASNARYEAKMAELKERNLYADVGTSEYLSPEQMEAEARREMTEDIETEAVRYADDCTRACQPSNRVTDLAPLFKNSSEAMKAFLQFQTSLNVIWQNLRYDMPYAVKQREFKRIAGTVIGYVCAGIFMNSVMEGIGGDDDDDETQALRNLIYYSTTQFTDAIPIMGSEITNAMDKIITGSRAYSQSGTDMTPSATKLLNALQKATSGDWQKAASLTAEGIGLFMGAPVSGVKEINKLLGKPLANGEVDLKKGVTDVYGIAGDILEE